MTPKAFIDQALAKGKVILIYFANPYKEGTLDGKFKMEIEYLRERGYTFIQIGNGLFEAVKK